jgi:hypothetical protein
MAILKHIKTNPDYCADEVQIGFEGVRVRVGRQTGNWYPDGKPWLASIHADIYMFGDQEKWATGLAAWGSSRREAILNARDYAKANTLRFPAGWLQEIMIVLDD